MQKKTIIGVLIGAALTAIISGILLLLVPPLIASNVKEGGPPMTRDRYKEVLRDIDTRSGDHDLQLTRKLQLARFKEALKESDVLAARDVNMACVGLSSELRATVLEKLSRIDEAISELTKAISHCQNHKLSANSLYLYRASLYAVCGRTELCVGDLKKMSSHGPEYQMLLSQCALANGNLPEALQIANSLLEANPSYSPALLVRAQIFQMLNQDSKAIADYNWLVNRSVPFDGYMRPDISTILRLRASAAYRLADYDQTIDDLTLADCVDSQNYATQTTGSRLLKAKSLARLRKYANAIDECDLEIVALRSKLAQALELKRSLSSQIK